MQFLKIISALRIRELLPKLGFVWVGCLYGSLELSIHQIESILEASIISFICGLSVFSFNSYTGYETDSGNERLKELSGVAKRAHLMISIIATTIGLSWLIILWDLRTWFGIIVLILWHLYSMKNGLKAVPYGGLGIAYFTQLLQFGFGYLFVVDDIRIDAVILASLFGFLVASGHMIHECIDIEADKKDGFQTTAVQHGFRSGLWISWICFAIGFLHLGIFAVLLGIDLRVITLAPSLLILMAIHPAFLLILRNLFFYRRLYLGIMAISIIVYGLLIFKM